MTEIANVLKLIDIDLFAHDQESVLHYVPIVISTIDKVYKGKKIKGVDKKLLCLAILKKLVSMSEEDTEVKKELIEFVEGCLSHLIDGIVLVRKVKRFTRC